MATSISISQLKTNPAKALMQAEEYPVQVQNRGQVKAYLIGRELYENLLAYIEDYIDKKTVRETDFKVGRHLDDVAKELGI